MEALLDLTREDDRHTAERLRREPVLWLGSIRPDGRPHLVPVWFLWDDPVVLIFSMPRTQKCRNLRARPEVRLALDTAAGGTDVVTIEGRASLAGPEDPLVGARNEAFATKYAAMLPRGGFAEWRNTFAQPVVAIASLVVAWRRDAAGLRYRVTPER